MRQRRRRSKTRDRVSEEQLDLLPDLTDGGWWQCRGIFSPTYLQRHLLARTEVAAAEDIRALYDHIKERWARNLPALPRRKEPYTRAEFLSPTLADLGWHFIPEEDLPEVPTRKTPDYCLFGDEETKQRIAAQTALDIFRASYAVLEAKKVQHPLDEVSRTETPGWFPSDQIQDYLRYAKDETGHRFFNWAILTNGNEWRLYCEHAGPSAYFAFHLARGPQFCSVDDFRLFVAVFRPEAFERRPPDQRCLLDDLREEALHFQVALEENLRKRIFDVLEELAEGFYFNADNHLSEPDLPKVYETSLIFLYRLLFVLYAESRGLLPAKRSGPGANRRYLDDFSLTRFIEPLRDSSAYPNDDLDDLYRQLLDLFHLINGSQPRKNRSLGVTRYNGGLFDPVLHPDIEKWSVAERTLANVLRQLVFAQPPARARSKQQVIQTGETIDYSTLEVRQLGDIYEGLLGAHLELRNGQRLELINERGQNQREGIFYTPDWVVLYLVPSALQPLLGEIEARPEVQSALKNGRRDNSFADAVLRLNIVDPAMGSGHFLVRATEWLAERIVRHPTTKRMTEQVVATGERSRSRDEILADELIPVSPGVPQEEAEIAYWRRRIVESCIYGVDTNSLAVELAKLSLWLTCIAIDEPLNFLDHHLHCGNSLLSVRPEEMIQPPAGADAEKQQLVLEVTEGLRAALRDIIAENARIEAQVSTELEIVKEKEGRWRKVRERLDPFLDVGNLWLAALAGLHIQPEDYRLLALSRVNPTLLTPLDKRRARALQKSLQAGVEGAKKSLNPFHWELEFPEVFHQPDGEAKPEARRGFDVVLGNPPYVSTHTSAEAEEAWRPVLERRAGYLEDLYVHFTDLGFSLLRPGGTFGFIVSDTFFTLNSKLQMRRLLQSNRLLALGQCDPFRATVDAAIFVARKEPMVDGDSLVFVQARYPGGTSRPAQELPSLAQRREIAFDRHTRDLHVKHAAQGCLRLHEAPVRIYRQALKQAFFEPRPAVLELYRRFNDPVKTLVEKWWDRISTSEKFAENLDAIRGYQARLKPGEITLVGLIAEGGQGMRTANNGRFLGYLAGTHRAQEVAAKRAKWTQAWLDDDAVKPVFLTLLSGNGGDPARPTANIAAWEACVEPLKERFTTRRLRFNRTDLYRVVPENLLATDEDFQFAWKRRKPELLTSWQREPQFAEFWREVDLVQGTAASRASLRRAQDISDDIFCRVCQDLQAWWRNENQRRSRARIPRIPRGALSLRSGEDYGDPADAPRIATIYNGLHGRGQWVPFRKGDPEGNRWTDNEPLFIQWSSGNVAWLFDNSGRRDPRMPVIRNAHLYFTPGVSYTLLGNHVALKAKLQEPCVFDAGASRLMPIVQSVNTLSLLAILNADVFSFSVKKFIKNTAAFEISDLRMMPIVIPERQQGALLTSLAEWAITAKRMTFTGEAPSNELAAFARSLDQQLAAEGPAYLRPGAQMRLLDTPEACLGIIERAVNWEVEKLYGVEGLGPFDEF